MHLDEEQVQRLLHGQLPRSAESSAREHLARCDDCRAHLAVAERDEHEVHALLGAVDHAPPLVDAEATIERARGKGFGQMRWAAGALLALGIAGAAYAVPGSPVQSWVEKLGRRLAARPSPAPEAPAPAAPEPQAVAGIAVAPGRRLEILFTSPLAEAQLRVSLTDSAEVVVRAPSGAATFTSDGGRLVIDNAGSADAFDIRIPRDAPWVEIRVAGSRLYLKEGSRITGP